MFANEVNRFPPSAILNCRAVNSQELTTYHDILQYREQGAISHYLTLSLGKTPQRHTHRPANANISRAHLHYLFTLE